MKRVRYSNLNKIFRLDVSKESLRYKFDQKQKSAARKAVSLRDWYAPNRIFSTILL